MSSTTLVNPQTESSDDDYQIGTFRRNHSIGNRLSSISLASSLSDNESESENDKFSIDDFFHLMKFERLRLISYILYRHKWPKMDEISPSSLAKAGFFYVEDDSVQCAFCRGIIKNWKPGEIPMEEHRRHFPRCPFVNGKYDGNVPLELDPQVNQNDQQANVETYQEPIQIKYNTSIVPIFPMFADKENRTKSFLSKNWKSELDIEKFVEAGFYFTGKKDATRCYHCGGVLCNWKSYEIPLEEHALFFPKCSFIIVTKGPDFLEFVKFKKEIIEMRSQLESSNNLKVNDINYLRKVTFKNFLQMKQTAAKLLTKLGIAQHNSLYSYYEEYLKKFYFFVDCQKLFQYFLEMNVMKSPDNDTNSDSESNTSIFSLLDSQDSDYSSSNSDIEDSSNDEAEKLTKKPVPEKKTNSNNLTCFICFDAEIQVVFCPCGHQMSCMKCAAQFNKCPICRQLISNKIRTYFVN